MTKAEIFQNTKQAISTEWLGSKEAKVDWLSKSKSSSECAYGACDSTF